MKKFTYLFFMVCIQLLGFGQSDNCGNASLLTINPNCSFSTGTTLGATQSLPGCSGNANDDVWYYFIANAPQINILVQSSTQFDAVAQVFSGTCGALNSISCKDANGLGQNEQLDLIGLVLGQQYYLRVYDYLNTNGGEFSICLSASTSIIPSNDEPCSAILLPEVTSSCNYSVFSTAGATATSTVPSPFMCLEGSAPQQGGFSLNSKDVWFKILVPETGNIHITAKPSMGQGAITDGVMALYSGNCNSLSQIMCSDDHSTYPGISNDLLPLITANNLIPGSFVYLRFWGYGNLIGTFGFCITTATNDECANALYICDINGYSATTSAAYTADRPGNMQGNNEDSSGINMPDGINTGGVFGQAGPWGTGASGFNVTINNNSWIRFTAAAPTALLNVTVYDCWIGNYPFGGLQMQIFSGTNCTNFIPVSDFKENSTGFTLTANNLVIGADYYLMVDGFAGDICAYTITAESGVLFPEIIDSPPICAGDTLVLSAPVGANSYLWQSGETNQSITVQPNNSQTYTCEVTGLCEYKQILETTVIVKPLPDLHVLNGDSLQICFADSILLTTIGAAEFQWSNGPPLSSWLIFPSNNAYYSVSGETDGCINRDSIYIWVNNLPEIELSVSGNSEKHCENSPVTLTASGALNYTWLLPDDSSLDTPVLYIPQLLSTETGMYSLIGSDSNGCRSMDSILLEAIALPEASIYLNDSILCLDEQLTLYTNSNNTCSWYGPNLQTSNEHYLHLSDLSFEDIGWYFLYVTDANGCHGLDSSYILVENSSDCLLIPELVTPNNDGKNDVWHISGLDPSTTHNIQIFNRWGNQIYTKKDFENNWDCRSNCGIMVDGKNGLVPTGTYFYILKTGGINGASHTGSLEIHY